MNRSGSGERDSTSGESRRRAQRQARLLDLRTYLASLFLIFGVVVTLAGVTADPAQLAKSSGMNLSLWTGLALFLLGIVFLIWLLSAPPAVEQESASDSQCEDEGN